MANERKNDQKIALVLGGTISESIAILPLMQFLKDSQISVDIVYSNGGMSLLNALWGLGRHDFKAYAEVIGDLIKLRNELKINLRTLYNIYKPKENYTGNEGFLQVEPYQNYLKALLENKTFSDLSYQSQMIATDVYTAESVSVNEGSLSDAIYASDAFFPLYPPIPYKGWRLASGIYKHYIPIRAAINNSPSTIIAVIPDFGEKLPTLSFLAYAQYFISKCMKLSQRGNQAVVEYDFNGQMIMIQPSSLEKNGAEALSYSEILDIGSAAVEEVKQTIIAACHP